MSYLMYPSFPDLPKEIQQEILDIVNNDTSYLIDDLLISSTLETTEMVNQLYGFSANETDLGYPGTEARKVFPNLVKYHFLDANDKIKDWVNTNLPVNAASINIQVIEKGEHIAPHIDEVRVQAINYLLSTGGDASLNFYKLKNPKDEKKIHPQIFIPYEVLECMETNLVPANVWHILPTNKIHSVENINPTERRISLSISIL